MTPRMHIIWDVLEAAKDNQDASVIAACRRLIEANRRGWRTHANQADKDLVYEFADGCGMGDGQFMIHKGQKVFIRNRLSPEALA